MGWLFGRKKAVPRAPFPQGRPFDENSLNLNQEREEKVITPEHVQAAVGLGKMQAAIENPSEGEIPVTQPDQFPLNQNQDHSYVKLDVYKKILTEANDIKEQILELKELSSDLDKSEYNEETSFIKLRSATKAMHDRLLQIDKIIFKGE